MKDLMSKRKKMLFLFFGGLNFSASYVTFVIFWLLLAKFIGYIGVVIINTIVSTLFSYLVQTKWVWKKIAVTVVGYCKYLGFQLIVTTFAIFVVPNLSIYLKVDLLIIQLLYSFIIVILTWFFLRLFVYKD
jgi:hypothetical protein